MNTRELYGKFSNLSNSLNSALYVPSDMLLFVDALHSLAPNDQLNTLGNCLTETVVSENLKLSLFYHIWSDVRQKAYIPLSQWPVWCSTTNWAISDSLTTFIFYHNVIKKHMVSIRLLIGILSHHPSEMNSVLI